MTAPLRWRSQLCPCGFCPDGTRIEWRYSLDIRFRPRRKDRDVFLYPSKRNSLSGKQTAKEEMR